MCSCLRGLIKIEGPPSYEKSLRDILNGNHLLEPNVDDLSIVLQGINGDDIKIKPQNAFNNLQLEVMENSKSHNWIFSLKALYILDSCVEENIQLQNIKSITMRGLQNYLYDPNYKEIDIEEFLDNYLELIQKKAELFAQPEPLIKLNKVKRKMRMEVMTTYQNLGKDIEQIYELELIILKLSRNMSQKILKFSLIKNILTRCIGQLVNLFRTQVQAIQVMMQKKDRNQDQDKEYQFTNQCFNYYKNLLDVSENIQNLFKTFRSYNLKGMNEILIDEQIFQLKNSDKILQNLQEQMNVIQDVEDIKIVHIFDPSVKIEQHTLQENITIQERDSEFQDLSSVKEKTNRLTNKQDSNGEIRFTQNQVDKVDRKFLSEQGNNNSCNNFNTNQQTNNNSQQDQDCLSVSSSEDFKQKQLQLQQQKNSSNQNQNYIIQEVKEEHLQSAQKSFIENNSNNGDDQQQIIIEQQQQQKQLQEKLEQEKLRQEQEEKEQQERLQIEKQEQEKQEQDKLQRQKEEQDRLQKEEQERLQREKEELEKLQREKEEQDKLQREKEEQDKLQREKEEQDRLQREKEEKERLQREKEEQERLQREKEEQERLQREKEEQDKLQRELEEKERQQREEQEIMQREQEEEKERQRIEQEQQQDSSNSQQSNPGIQIQTISSQEGDIGSNQEMDNSNTNNQKQLQQNSNKNNNNNNNKKKGIINFSESSRSQESSKSWEQIKLERRISQEQVSNILNTQESYQDDQQQQQQQIFKKLNTEEQDQGEINIINEESESEYPTLDSSIIKSQKTSQIKQSPKHSQKQLTKQFSTPLKTLEEQLKEVTPNRNSIRMKKSPSSIMSNSNSSNQNYQQRKSYHSKSNLASNSYSGSQKRSYYKPKSSYKQSNSQQQNQDSNNNLEEVKQQDEDNNNQTVSQFTVSSGNNSQVQNSSENYNNKKSKIIYQVKQETKEDPSNNQSQTQQQPQQQQQQQQQKQQQNKRKRNKKKSKNQQQQQGSVIYQKKE